jgi:hypothetical protein
MQRRVRHKGMEKRLEDLERRFKEQSPPEA